MGVKRLPREADLTELIGTIAVPLLTNEGVTPEPRLQPNLVPFAGDEGHFDQGGIPERLEDPVSGLGILPVRVARMGLLLHERPTIPDEPVPPDADRWRGMSVDDGK